MKKMKQALQIFATASALSLGVLFSQNIARGGVAPSITLNGINTLPFITSVQHGVSAGYETLTITGGSTTLTIRNESSSALAARLIATCYKNAQAALTGSSVGFAVMSANISSGSSGITGAVSSSSNLGFVLKSTFPGSTVDLQCALGSSGPSL